MLSIFKAGAVTDFDALECQRRTFTHRRGDAATFCRQRPVIAGERHSQVCQRHCSDTGFIHVTSFSQRRLVTDFGRCQFKVFAPLAVTAGELVNALLVRSDFYKLTGHTRIGVWIHAVFSVRDTGVFFRHNHPDTLW